MHLKIALTITMLLSSLSVLGKVENNSGSVCSSNIEEIEQIIENNNLQGMPDISTYIVNTFWIAESKGKPFHISQNDSGNLRISIYTSAKGGRLGIPITVGVKVCPIGDGSFLVKSSFGQKIKVTVLVPEEPIPEEVSSDKKQQFIESNYPENVFKWTSKSSLSFKQGVEEVEPLKFKLEGALDGVYSLASGESEEEKNLIHDLLSGSVQKRGQARKAFVASRDFRF